MPLIMRMNVLLTCQFLGELLARSLMLPVLSLGLRGLADRMVDDFVRVADAEA